VHHTNEIAQTQACCGTRLANFWMHGYFLQIDESRMGKSAGNFLRLQTLIDRGYDPLAWRMFCLTAHYRTKLNFTWEGLDAAATALDRLRESVLEWGEHGDADEGIRSKFLEIISQDLDTPRALALVWEVARGNLPAGVREALILDFDRVLGLQLSQWKPGKDEIPASVAALAHQRRAAREARRWKDADALREQIRAAGYEIEDTPHGPRIRRQKPR
jgi:cysteinyl-tRNA synthetase